MTKISLKIKGREFTVVYLEDDIYATELIKSFCILLRGQTFLPCTIIDSLKEVAKELEEDENMCDV